jgi:hypothetical protein
MQLDDVMKIMKTTYFSFQGKKLKMYKIRDDFYALDSDIAAYFQVNKKYLLSVSSRNKVEYKEPDKILLDKTEQENIKKETPYPKTARIFAFNLSGIMTLSFGINKGPIASKMSIEVVKETTSKIKEMRRIQELCDKVKKQKNELTGMIVELEIARNRIPRENHDKYEIMYNGINEILDSMHLFDKQLDIQTEKINKLIESCPEPTRSLLFNPAWDK